MRMVLVGGLLVLCVGLMAVAYALVYGFSMTVLTAVSRLLPLIGRRGSASRPADLGPLHKKTPSERP